MKGFALGLALKQRRNATRKSPITFKKYEKGRFYSHRSAAHFSLGLPLRPYHPALRDRDKNKCKHADIST